MPVSFAGLDMPWLSDPEKRLPPRPKVKKWHAPNRRSDTVAAPYFMGDIAEFISPVGDTPERISSRSELRNHEKKHNVYQCGDFKPGEITSKNEALKAERQALAEAHTTPAQWVQD